MRSANIFSRLRRLGNASRKQASNQILFGKYDLPSMGEFNSSHLIDNGRNKNVKSQFTNDEKTLSIVKRIIESNKHEEFFTKLLLTPPNNNSQEQGSLKVKISDIRDFPRPYRDFESNKHRDSLVCVGGPAAEDQIILSNMIPKIKDRLHERIFITRDYGESNVWHSAKQSHARHSSALNTDAGLTGHALLPTLMLRKILGTDLDDVLSSDYKKIDVDFTLDPKKLRIYFGNELNWLKQEFKKQNGELTEHHVNRLEGMLSQDIKDVMQEITGADLTGKTNNSNGESSAIHVTFTEKNSREVEHENIAFAESGIKSEKLTPDEIKFFFESNEIQNAWRYHGDTYNKFYDHEAAKEYSQQEGAQWIEGKEINRIFLIQNKESGNAQMAGLMTKDGEYIYANKLHFTGGYKVKYEFDKEDSITRYQSNSTLRNLFNKIEDALDIQRPTNTNITTATGISINAVFRKSEKIKRIIDKYGSTGEIAITNSHWTMMAQDDNHIIVRITGGGNTGSEEYNPTYYLNTIANTRRIFGDDLIGVLSTYGCPRAVNARNTTEFTQIAEGAVFSDGKGGTGNTKRSWEAYMGLIAVGFEKEGTDYFNNFNNRHGEPLGDSLKEAYEQAKAVEFLHDNIANTNRRMGYDESLSLSEMATLGILLVSLSMALSKVKTKEDDSQSTEPSSSPTSPDCKVTQDNITKIKL